MELLDVVDENNNFTGEKLNREIVHEKGLFHREVAVWIVNEKNEVLIQKRAATKKQSPNKWALTAGHIDSGEEPIDVAIRETEEELGLTVPRNEMKFLFTYKIEKKFNDKQYNNHFKYVYYTITNKKISEFILQKEELSEVKYITIEELKEIMNSNNEEYVFTNSEYIEKSIKILEEKLSEEKKIMRKKVIAGNWKMNMLPNEAIEYVESFEKLVKDTNNEVILCVPYTDLFYCLNFAQDTKIKIGAQNMHFEEKGAYTGEVSGQMLKSIGVEYVIIGHSERRQYFAETDETVNKKIKSAFANGLKPIVCVGEKLEEREAGKAESLVTNQVKLALDGLTNEQVKGTIIAYEPIWAIGTGKTATSEDANEMCKAIRTKIEEIYGKEVAEEVIIQYGGSVKSSNAKELFSMSDIDGGLVGGASLKPDEFSKIVNYDKE